MSKNKIGRNAPCPCGSGRKYKHCCLGTSVSTVAVRPIDNLADDDDFHQIFLGEGLEPLTDALIDELVAGGWERAGTEWACGNGASYSRPRHSLMFPPGALDAFESGAGLVEWKHG